MQASFSPQPYALGLDIGTNSLGWAVLAVDPKDSDRATGLLAMGSRLFPDGRAIDKAHMGESLGETLHSARRRKINTARAHQRNRARRGRLLRMLSESLNLIRTNGHGRGVRVSWIDPFKSSPSNRDEWLRKESVFAARAACASKTLDASSKYDRARLARALFSLLVNRGTLLTDDGFVEDIEESAPPKSRKSGKTKKTPAIATKETEESDASILADCLNREDVVAEECGKGGLGIWLAKNFHARHPYAPIRARKATKDSRAAHWKKLDDETLARVGAQSLPGRTSRKLVMEEFERIRMTQADEFAKYGMSKLSWDDLHALVFERAPYNVVRWPCPYLPTEDRVARFDPRAQRYLAWEKAWNLRAYDARGIEIDLDGDIPVGATSGERSLRRQFLDALLSQTRLTWKQAIDILRLPESTIFNRVNASGKPADWVGHPFASLGAWMTERDIANQREQSQSSASNWAELRQEILKIFEAPIRGGDRDFSPVPLEIRDEVRNLMVAPPRGSIPFGTTMLDEMLARIESIQPYAAKNAAFNAIIEDNPPDDFAVREYDAGRLPYYGAAFNGMYPKPPVRRTGPYSESFGPSRLVMDVEKRYGRIPNISVHIALNQTQRVVNEIIKRFGRPTRVVVETTRQLHLSDRGRALLLKRIARNEKLNDEAKNEIRSVRDELVKDDPQWKRIRRYRLWKELYKCGERESRLCPYCGLYEITMKDAIDGNSVEVEHIFPRKLGGGSEMNNLTLACSRCNSEKTDSQTPFAAFATDAPRWERIREATSFMPPKKRRMILDPETARAKFLGDQLASTSWAAKLLLEWLRPLCEVQTNVLASRGELTNTLRREWGLQDIKKNKAGERVTDGRHHAVDALITAVLSRSLLQKAASGKNFAIENIDVWASFPTDVRNAYYAIVTSHKADRPKIQLSEHGDRAISVPGDLHYENIYPQSGVKRQKASAIFPASITKSSMPILGEDATKALDRARQFLKRLSENQSIGSLKCAPEEIERLRQIFDKYFGETTPSFLNLRNLLSQKSEFWLRCNGKVGPNLSPRPPSETGEICTQPWECLHGSFTDVFRRIFNAICKWENFSKFTLLPNKPDRGESKLPLGPCDKRRGLVYGQWKSEENLCAVIESLSPLSVRLFKLLEVIANQEDLREFLASKPSNRIYKRDALLLDGKICIISSLRMRGARLLLGLVDANSGKDVDAEPSLQTLLERYSSVELGVVGVLGDFRRKIRLKGA